jgi:hypothetical protein
MRDLLLRRVGGLLVWTWVFATACSSTQATVDLPPACTAPALGPGILTGGSAANGSVTGADVVAALCQNGALAQLIRQQIQAPPLPARVSLLIESQAMDPTKAFQVVRPADATHLLLMATFSISAAQPGVYTEADACGGLSLCVSQRVPASLHCPTALQGDVCPPGCDVSTPGACAPVEPTTCYEANASAACNAGVPSTSQGSWRLTLTSVEPGISGNGAGDPEFLVPHGTMDATLVKMADGASTGAGDQSTLQLSLSF